MPLNGATAQVGASAGILSQASGSGDDSGKPEGVPVSRGSPPFVLRPAANKRLKVVPRAPPKTATLARGEQSTQQRALDGKATDADVGGQPTPAQQQPQQSRSQSATAPSSTASPAREGSPVAVKHARVVGAAGDNAGAEQIAAPGTRTGEVIEDGDEERLIKLVPSNFRTRGAEGDFVFEIHEAMASPPAPGQRTLFVFNDTCELRETPDEGNGNAQIRPFNRFSRREDVDTQIPYCAGVTLGFVQRENREKQGYNGFQTMDDDGGAARTYIEKDLQSFLTYCPPEATAVSSTRQKLAVESLPVTYVTSPVRTSKRSLCAAWKARLRLQIGSCGCSFFRIRIRKNRNQQQQQQQYRNS